MVNGDRDGLQIHDIHSTARNVIRIPISRQVPTRRPEYFLLSNRQIGSYYDDFAPASGLLIWHIDENRRGLDRNRFEEHKGVDLECAAGLFVGGGPGTTGNTANSERGGDNLDYWTTDDNYRMT